MIQPTGADLPAQLLRAKLFSVEGFGLWSNWWYGGHYLLSYSALFPPLAALLTPELIAAIAGVITAAAFEALVHGVWGDDCWLGACWLGAATVVEPLSGRLTFALGLCGAALCALALSRRHGAPAATLAFLTALASPVAALFAALAGATTLLTGICSMRGREAPALAPRGSNSATPRVEIRPARAWPLPSTALAGAAVVTAALAPTAALAIAFPQGGSQPFAIGTLWPILLIGAVLLVSLPRSARTLRTATALYALGCLAAYAIPTPVGANAARLGELTAGPLAALLLYRGRSSHPARRERPSSAQLGEPNTARRERPNTARRERPDAARRERRPHTARWQLRSRRSRLGLLALAALPLTYIQAHDAITDIQHASRAPADSAAYYRPLIAYLEAQPGAARRAFRVEVPFTQGHWEAYRLAPALPLARGWERQLDIADDPLFYDRRPLTAACYKRWLQRLAVRYVALSDAPLDYSARAEAKLIDTAPRYLKLVKRLRHWRVYRVQDATPIVSGAATLTQLGAQSVALRFTRPGAALVRVRFSPYWRLNGLRGCVAPAGALTRVSAHSSGSARLIMAFSLGRIGARSPRCN